VNEKKAEFKTENRKVVEKKIRSVMSLLMMTSLIHSKSGFFPLFSESGFKIFRKRILATFRLVVGMSHFKQYKMIGLDYKVPKDKNMASCVLI
jgi:hypothetical protein